MKTVYDLSILTPKDIQPILDALDTIIGSTPVGTLMHINVEVDE